MKLRKIMAMGLATIMAVSSMSALAADNGNEAVYTYIQDGQEENVTQADLDAGHWDKDALGNTAPVIYENFPMSMTGFTNDFAELSLDCVYMKNINEVNSVHLTITNLLDDTVVYDNDITEQSFYSPILEVNGQYEVKLTEEIEDKITDYTKVVFVNKTAAQMPEFVSNPSQDENAQILIADVDTLRAGQTTGEDGEIVVDTSIAKYNKVCAKDFLDYCNSLSGEKTYRVFALDGNRQCGGFFSKSQGNEIYDLTIDAYDWEDIYNTEPLTTPTLTIDDVKSSAEEVRVTDASFRLKDTSKQGGYAAYAVYLPQSFVGSSAKNAQFRISVQGTNKISMKVWSDLKNGVTPQLLRTYTSNNNTNTTYMDVYTEDYKNTAQFISFYVLVYFPSATDGYAMLNVEAISGYEDDVTGSVYNAYNGESAYRELNNTEFTLTDSWDIDAFCIDYWGTTDVEYKVEIKNRSLEDQAKVDGGEYAKGSPNKTLSIWAISNRYEMTQWDTNNVYTVPKNTDMTIYCYPYNLSDNVITIQNVSTGTNTANKYQLSYKMVK